MHLDVHGLITKSADELTQFSSVALTSMTWDRTDAPPGEAGSWRRIPPAVPATVMGSEYIPVPNHDVEYTFSVKIHENNAAAAANVNDGYMYMGFACFDVDRNSIAPYHVNEKSGTRTRLTKNLNPGDTTVHVTSTKNWTSIQSSSSSHHLNSIIFWDWKDSTGRTWSPGTYSRHVIVGTSTARGYKSMTSTTLVLSSPYAGPAVASGTRVSNTFSGGPYAYGVSNQKVTSAWTKYLVSIVGTAHGNAPGDKFWQGTAFIRPLLLINRTKSGSGTSSTDQRIAITDFSVPMARCFQTLAYNGGALALWADGITAPVVDVWRADHNGANAELVRGGLGIDVSYGHIIVEDPEAPFNEKVIYSVRVHSTDASKPGRTIVSTGGCLVSSEPTLFADKSICSPVYLNDPLEPALGYWFGLLNIDVLSHPERSQVFDILHRHAPVAVSQLRSTPRTTITLLTRTLRERTDLLHMIASGRILLYRNPDPSYPENNWYLALGEVSEERISADHRDPHRRWRISVSVVDRPIGLLVLGVRANRTYVTYATKEPDGKNPITPDRYGGPGMTGAYSDYVDYIHVLIGGGAAGTQMLSTGGGTGSVVGAGRDEYRYPTIQAAKTSWSLV